MWIFSNTIRNSDSCVRRKVSSVAFLKLPGRIAAICCLVVAFDPSYLFPAIPGPYQVKEIKPNVFIWIPENVIYLVGDPRFDRAGTAAFIITKEGVVVVNTTNSPFNAREVLYEIRERTDLPVKYVIDTDARGDHMLGNEVFVDQGATIISTSAAKNKMSRYQQDLERRMEDDDRLQMRMRGIHLTLPGQTFDAELTLQLGGETFKLIDVGQGDVAGDAAVYMPQEKVLFLGDLYENGLISRHGLNDVPVRQKILDKIENMDVVSYVPGMGPPGDKNDFEEFRQFLEWIQGALDPSAMLDKSPFPGPPARMAIVP